MKGGKGGRGSACSCLNPPNIREGKKRRRSSPGARRNESQITRLEKKKKGKSGAPLYSHKREKKEKEIDMPIVESDPRLCPASWKKGREKGRKRASPPSKPNDNAHHWTSTKQSKKGVPRARKKGKKKKYSPPRRPVRIRKNEEEKEACRTPAKK